MLIAPQAYMQQAPPGYAVPNGAGPRPSMPPTPIPSHAHPYYQQSPQCAYLAHVTLLPMLIFPFSATCCSLPDDDASPWTAPLLRPLAGPACTNGWCWPRLSLSCLAGHCTRPYCLPRCSLLLTKWRSLRCSVTRARHGLVCTIAPPQCCLLAVMSCCSLQFVVMQCKTNKKHRVRVECKWMHGVVVRYVETRKATWLIYTAVSVSFRGFKTQLLQFLHQLL